MTARWSVLMKSYRDAVYNRKQIERRKQLELTRIFNILMVEFLVL